MTTYAFLIHMKKLCNYFTKGAITFICTLFLLCTTLFAQQIIKGVITGTDHTPLFSATVTVKNTARATTTEANGHFRIAAKTGDILIVSYVGYRTKEIKLDNETSLKISLYESIANLDEIIVTGYTSQKIKEITGSVSVVKPKELVAVPAGQVEQMLQGRVAGLTVITSGEPGAQSQVYLHGAGNFGNVTPLYIIDGVGGNINSLNLYDIDSTAGPIYVIVPFNKTGTDWFHELFKPATSQNHTITVSGGGDKGHYLLSFGYLNQQGTYLNTYLKRFTTRINTEFTLLNTIRIGENIQLSYSENHRIGSIDQALTYFPFLPVYDIKGNSTNYGPSFGSGYAAPGPASNPVTARILSKDDRYNNWEVFGNAYAEVDFLKTFTFRTSFGGPLTYYYSYNFNYGSYEPPPPSAAGYPNSFSEWSGYNSSWTWTNTLNYSQTLWKDHHIKALVGTEEKSNYNRELGGNRTGYASNSPFYRFLSTGRPTGLTNYSFGGTSYLYSF